MTKKYKYMAIPADKGWYAIDWVFDRQDGPLDVSREPIVSFIVSVNEQDDTITTRSIPVTVEHTSSFFEGAIERPDGTVFIPGGKTWNNLHEYLLDIRSRHHNNSTTHFEKAMESYEANRNG